MFPLETGGVLIGWRDVYQDYVIESVVGPGSGAVHNLTSFQPDSSWQKARLSQIYAESDRRLVYLGDWHSHPRGRPRMSRRDKKTLKSIARFKPARLQEPVMLIWSGVAERASIGGWVLRGARPVRGEVRLWHRYPTED